MVATSAPFLSRSSLESIETLGISFEPVEFPAENGLMLRGFYFPSPQEDAPTLLYAPATAHDFRSGTTLVLPFHRAGYNVLLFSYRGHGASDGNPFGFTYGARESFDVDAAVRFLREVKGADRIGAIGHSAGAVSIILSAARNEDINAVVAASPFNSVEEVWETNRPVIIPKPLLDFSLMMSELRKDFSRNQVRPEDVIDQIAPNPILLVHGTGDRRITQEQAMRLFDAAEEPKRMWLVEGASHEGVRTPVLDEMVGEIIAFFDDALRSKVVAIK
jgi:dipeptidyl aminopeptidase/acylaminoacyl peptidase